VLYKNFVHTMDYLNQFATKIYKNYFYKETDAEQTLYIHTYVFMYVYM